LVFLLLFSLIFSFTNVNSLICKNALEIIYVEETWDSETLSFNVFIKNKKALSFIKEAPALISLVNIYIQEELKKLSIEKGFNYFVRSNLEFNAFSINISKSNFLKNYKAIIGVFFNNNVDESYFKKLKKNIHNQDTSLASNIYSSKSIIYKFNNIVYEDYNNISFKSFYNFLNLYLSANNILISLSNFKDILFLKKHLETFKSNINAYSDVNNFFELIQAIPKRTLKTNSINKKTSLNLGLTGSRCNTKESILSELFISLDYLNFRKSYDCFSSFGFFEFIFEDITLNVDEQIISFRNNLKRLTKDLNESMFLELKNNLKLKYDLIYYDKNAFMFLLGKSYILTNSLNPFLLFKEALNKVELEELKNFVYKISEANFYEVVVKG